MVDIVTRADKGVPLSNAEVDSNFTNLKDAVEGITPLDGVSSVQDASQVIISLNTTDAESVGGIAGDEAGQVGLVNAFLSWRFRVHKNGAAYVVQDASEGGASYDVWTSRHYAFDQDASTAYIRLKTNTGAVLGGIRGEGGNMGFVRSGGAWKAMYTADQRIFIYHDDGETPVARAVLVRDATNEVMTPLRSKGTAPGTNFDFSKDWFSVAVSANITFTTSNVPTESDLYLPFAIEVVVTGSPVITWPASFRWPGNASPTLAAGRYLITGYCAGGYVNVTGVSDKIGA